MAITPATGYTAGGAFSTPYNLAIDGEGNVSVADAGNRRKSKR